MNTWVIPCNTAYYDIITHFKNNNNMLWNGVSKTEIGDTIYIYLGKPYSEIRYKCRVSEIYVDRDEVIKSGLDSLLKDTKNRKNTIRIQLEKEFPAGLLKYQLLKSQGLVSVQSQMRMSERLVRFLNSQEQEEE